MLKHPDSLMIIITSPLTYSDYAIDTGNITVTSACGDIKNAGKAEPIFTPAETRRFESKEDGAQFSPHHPDCNFFPFF